MSCCSVCVMLPCSVSVSNVCGRYFSTHSTMAKRKEGEGGEEDYARVAKIVQWAAEGEEGSIAGRMSEVRQAAGGWAGREELSDHHHSNATATGWSQQVQVSQAVTECSA